ncbi:DUF6481 family protein [Palleronia sp. LCG004]|uniref:DUF6481 family protein n=1 Tax=Palleronia sp. LCG004 TaxID=3079304 RepID=UPI002941D771|nr:DUF6481 family protein [Palleronia sp. LCG004]WOI57970.1 DUF6481 family protein [Palleronia sp. LCG004]
MKNKKENDLADRRKAATESKAALLQAHRAAMEAAEPTRLAREEERLAVAKAREERRAERERVKLEEQERVAAEAARQQAAADAAAGAEARARQKVQDDMISRVVRDEATRKAERDRRYANRKARKA